MERSSGRRGGLAMRSGAECGRRASPAPGARLFNAQVATGIPAREWCEHADTVSVCSSKGLGAPVGSLLAGDGEIIREARRARKAFGGGMRQAGVIAAGSLYAFEHHTDRLAEDHERAKKLAAGLRDAGYKIGRAHV